ncbi:uncharacterized protein BDR25DRAFT_360022 [Lindgomyces ingoldianus]|uniref:Uncharacterized protein n=1 Tax=Lindgomyces ingoldianus TaxID=673940 RepID=A0ACB6QH19_9PLEO|nr:uncharacterized protein BDR25DRAFT_360022 [Lindgomyces ingoldianus]KAF2465863.1 hypothetical protein BDR25DRAFT_360022 [Lindgomyces ingoldianus]
MVNNQNSCLANIFQYILISVPLVAAPSAFWINPPSVGLPGEYKYNSLIEEGNDQTLKWFILFPRTNIQTFQQHENGSLANQLAIKRAKSRLRITEYDWTVDATGFYSEDGKSDSFIVSYYIKATTRPVVSSVIAPSTSLASQRRLHNESDYADLSCINRVKCISLRDRKAYSIAYSNADGTS